MKGCRKDTLLARPIFQAVCCASWRPLPPAFQPVQDDPVECTPQLCLALHYVVHVMLSMH